MPGCLFGKSGRWLPQDPPLLPMQWFRFRNAIEKHVVRSAPDNFVLFLLSRGVGACAAAVKSFFLQKCAAKDILRVSAEMCGNGGPGRRPSSELRPNFRTYTPAVMRCGHSFSNQTHAAACTLNVDPMAESRKTRRISGVLPTMELAAPPIIAAVPFFIRWCFYPREKIAAEQKFNRAPPPTIIFKMVSIYLTLAESVVTPQILIARRSGNFSSRVQSVATRVLWLTCAMSQLIGLTTGPIAIVTKATHAHKLAANRAVLIIAVKSIATA